ncbi:MAG: flagellar hook-length control protein FliK [Lachnospiraceae bacterium]|nr:flagellar hook-length control protein FliK [Lachnospiraceae bacterium]
MTSANVSNMTMQVAVSKNLVTKAEQQNGGSDFMQVMSESMQGGRQKESVVATDKNVVDRGDAPVKVESKPNEIKSVEPNAVDEETVTKISEEAENFAEEVKSVISEKLGVSEDEIVDAMETLGLTFLDLTDKTNLAQLVSELTNCESNVELLMNESFADIVTDIGNKTENMLVSTGYSVEELRALLDVSQETLAAEEMPAEVLNSMEESLAETQGALELPGDVVLTVEEQDTQMISEFEEVIPVTTQTDEPENTDDAEMTEEATLEFKTTEESVENTKQNTSEEENPFSQNQNAKREEGVVLHHQEDMVGVNHQTIISRYEPMTGEITLQTGEVVDVREIIDQIVEAARTTITSEDTTLEMLLHPEGLGKILMEVTQRDGKVTAHIFTQDENVKQALEHQIVQLKDQMNQGGTKVNSIEVSVGTHEFERNLEEDQHNRQQGEAEQQRENHRTRNINLNNLDELSGLMTEEEELVTKIMRENGNSVNYTA